MCWTLSVKPQIFFSTSGIGTGVRLLPCVYLLVRILHGIIESLAVFTNRGLRGKLTQCNVLCLFFFCPCRPVTEKVQSAAKSTFSEIQSLLRKVHNARIRSCNFKKATAPLMPSWSWDVIKLTYWFLWIYKCLFHKLHLQSLGIFRALSFFSPNGSIMCPRNPVTCEIHAYFSHLLQFPGGQTCIMYA